MFGALSGIYTGTTSAAELLFPQSEMDARLVATGQGTIAAVLQSTAQDGAGNISGPLWKGNATGDGEHYPFTDGNIYLGALHPSGTRWIASSPPSSIYEPHILMAAFKNGAQAAYFNGVSISTASAAVDPRLVNSTPARIGANAKVYAVFFWDRFLTDLEARAFAQNPWQIFRKQSRIYFLPSAGGGAITGSGTPAAQSATVAGTATRTITGLGTPSAQSATAAGTAEREITGSGAPVSQDATVSGTGSVSAGVSGSGVLSAQSATVAGTSTRTVTASGTPSAQSATVAGTAEREVTGSGTPTAQSATVVGTGQIGNIVTGSGAPAAQSATVAGTAEREITSSGAVSAQSSTVAGTGVRVITGTGSPNSTRRNGIRL